MPKFLCAKYPRVARLLRSEISGGRVASGNLDWAGRFPQEEIAKHMGQIEWNLLHSRSGSAPAPTRPNSSLDIFQFLKIPYSPFYAGQVPVFKVSQGWKSGLVGTAARTPLPTGCLRSSGQRQSKGRFKRFDSPVPRRSSYSLSLYSPRPARSVTGEGSECSATLAELIRSPAPRKNGLPALLPEPPIHGAPSEEAQAPWTPGHQAEMQP